MSGDTPDNTGKTPDQKPQRLNEKLSERLIIRDAGWMSCCAWLEMAASGACRCRARAP
jgi:hypothetical protein